MEDEILKLEETKRHIDIIFLKHIMAERTPPSFVGDATVEPKSPIPPVCQVLLSLSVPADFTPTVNIKIHISCKKKKEKKRC